MSQRFYVSPPVGENKAMIAGPEAHHLLHVMRAKVGDEVVLFDGVGYEYRARISALRRQEASVEILHRTAVGLEPGPLVAANVECPRLTP